MLLIHTPTPGHQTPFRRHPWQILSTRRQEIGVKWEITNRIDIQMIQQQLSSMWTFWSYYSMSSKDKGSQNQSDYHKNLVKVLAFSTFAELAYALEESKFGSLDNFFTNLNGKKILKFEVEKDEFKQIDAISLFRDDIEPTWQYGDNSKGGQFIAVINRDGNPNANNIYRSLVIALAGDIFPNPEDIIGARFVQKTNFSRNEFIVKVEIWTRFNSDQQEKIERFTKAFEGFANEVQWTIPKFEFKNNRK